MNEEEYENVHTKEEIGPERKEGKFVPILILIGVVVIGGVFVWYHWFWEKEAVAPIEKKAAVVVTPKPVPMPEPERLIALTETQKKFSDIFTESLLRETLANAGKGFDLAMFRNMIRIAMNAEFLGDRPGMTWGKLQKERTKIQEMARKELADPVFLKMLWKRYGNLVVTVVKTSGKSGSVKKLCIKAIPFFSGELSHSRFVQLNDYYKTDAQLEREIQKRRYSKDAIHALTQKLDRKYRALKRVGLDDTDIYFFEFSMRRIHEGGRDLARAYGEILTDFSNAL